MHIITRENTCLKIIIIAVRNSGEGNQKHTFFLSPVKMYFQQFQKISKLQQQMNTHQGKHQTGINNNNNKSIYLYLKTHYILVLHVFVIITFKNHKQPLELGKTETLTATLGSRENVCHSLCVFLSTNWLWLHCLCLSI